MALLNKGPNFFSKSIKSRIFSGKRRGKSIFQTLSNLIFRNSKVISYFYRRHSVIANKFRSNRPGRSVFFFMKREMAGIAERNQIG